MFAINQTKSRRRHGRIRFPDGSWRQLSSGCEDVRLGDETFETMQYIMNQSNKPHNNSRQALARFMRRTYQEKFNEQFDLVTTDEFLKRIVAINRHYVADSTQAQTAKTAEWYFKFLQSEGREGCLLEDNTEPVVRRFGVYLIEVAKHGIESANERLAKLQTIFSDPVAERLLDSNPAKGVRLKDRNSESEEEMEIHQPWAKRHIDKIIDSGIAPGCNPELAIFTLLSSDLGGRGGDMFALDRAMFRRSTKLQRNFFKYYARKPKKWHKVYPFEPTVGLVQEDLDYHLLDRSENALFFPTFGHRTGPGVPDKEFNNGSSNGMNYYGYFLDALTLRTLIPSELGRNGYDHASHSNRVLCVTMMAQENVPESVTCKRVIHKGQEIHRIYQKHSPEAVQRAISGGTYNEEEEVNITFSEFKAAVLYATERLRTLRGQLDLHNGSLKVGDLTNRARLVPVAAMAASGQAPAPQSAPAGDKIPGSVAIDLHDDAK